MLRVYGHYKCLILSLRRSTLDARLTSKDGPALKGLNLRGYASFSQPTSAPSPNSLRAYQRSSNIEPTVGYIKPNICHQNYFVIKGSNIYFDLKHASNRAYTGLVWQGVISSAIEFIFIQNRWRINVSGKWRVYSSCWMYLTLSGLNLPLSSSSTTSRELLSQFLTCSGWSWFHVGEKLRKIAMYW